MHNLIFESTTSQNRGIGPYTAGRASYLVSRGNSVDVVTGLPSYPEWKVHADFRGTIYRTDVVDGVRVHRRWQYVPARQSASRRMFYEASFFLTRLSGLLLKRPDVVMGIVPALAGGVLAKVAAARFNLPYCVLFQDLMGAAAAQSGISGGSRIAYVVGLVERWVANGASAIGIIAEGFRPNLERVGVAPHRIHRVRNWSRLKEPSEA